MTDTVNPSLKRKLNSNDSADEDELLLEFLKKNKKDDLNENESNKVQVKDETATSEAKEDDAKKVEEKENKCSLSSAIQKSLQEPTKSNVSSPARKILVQSKLGFSPLQTKPTNAKSETSSSPVDLRSPPSRADGEWFVEDYLSDNQWFELLKEEFEKDYFKEINRVVKEGYRRNIVRPPKELIFNALNSTKLNEIKVVIIGQDPYHDDGQAHGLAFSVPRGINLPPSLRNIYKELSTDLTDFKRDEKLGGCLQKWTQEGVFLLNTFLTVEAHKAGSHSKIGWETFTDRVISLVSQKNNGCAFVLWGNFAQRKEGIIDKKKHKIIKSAHPSPFSMTRFFGSKPFSQANSYLKSIGKKPVNWSLV